MVKILYLDAPNEGYVVRGAETYSMYNGIYKEQRGLFEGKKYYESETSTIPLFLYFFEGAWNLNLERPGGQGTYYSDSEDLDKSVWNTERDRIKFKT